MPKWPFWAAPGWSLWPPALLTQWGHCCEHTARTPAAVCERRALLPHCHPEWIPHRACSSQHCTSVQDKNGSDLSFLFTESPVDQQDRHPPDLLNQHLHLDEIPEGCGCPTKAAPESRPDVTQPRGADRTPVTSPRPRPINTALKERTQVFTEQRKGSWGKVRPSILWPMTEIQLWKARTDFFVTWKYTEIMREHHGGSWTHYIWSFTRLGDTHKISSNMDHFVFFVQLTPDFHH